MNTTNKNTEELGLLLDKHRKTSVAKYTEERNKITEEGITSVANSGVLDKALSIGDKAPK